MQRRGIHRIVETHPTMSQSKLGQTMMTIKELNDKYYAGVDWVTLISSLMFSSKSKAAIKEDQLIVTNPDFIVKLKNLMEKTPPKTVANLIGFSVMSHVISKKASALDIISKVDNGTMETKDCEIFLSSASLFSKASSALYVKKYFSPKQKTMAEDLVNKTLSEMKLLLEDLKWMDNTTKTKAITKIYAMLSYVGYNNEVLDTDKMFDYHDSFLEKMDSKSFFNNQVINIVLTILKNTVDCYYI